MQLAVLGAVAFIHEHEYLADSRARLGLQLFDIRLEVVDILAAEFVDERAQQARLAWPIWGKRDADERGYIILVCVRPCLSTSTIRKSEQLHILIVG